MTRWAPEWADYERLNRKAARAYAEDFCQICHGILTSAQGWGFRAPLGKPVTCRECKREAVEKETA